MRIVEGLEQGLAVLSRTPGYDEPKLSPNAARRTAEVFGEPLTATQAVRRILDDVRLRGDDAVREYTRRIDGVEPGNLEVPKERWRGALASIPKELADALRIAADRVRTYHEACMPQEWRDDHAGYGQRLVPIERVGLYVPGGTAEYPSTVLMSAVPAKVAGVPQVILCTPAPSPATLAAAEIAGVDRLFVVGELRRLVRWPLGPTLCHGWTRYAGLATSSFPSRNVRCTGKWISMASTGRRRRS